MLNFKSCYLFLFVCTCQVEGLLSHAVEVIEPIWTLVDVIPAISDISDIPKEKFGTISLYTQFNDRRK